MAIGSLEIKKAIKILEKTYKDVCTIYHREKVVVKGITKTKEVVLYDNIKCRLCINNVIQPMQDGVYYSTSNKYVIMVSVELNIPLNSVINLTTREGVTLKFKSGYPFKLRTHQSIAVTLYESVA